MDRLVHCLYASVAAEEFSDLALSHLLEHARVANEAAGVTGLLVHSQGAFFQVLEGRPLAVETLFDRIYADPRLGSIVHILFEPIADRSFADWSMGFAQLTPAECAQILGTGTRFARGSSLANLDQADARALFEAFASGGWRTRLWSDARMLAASA